jgi:aryl-alcohol dehydrogenase-like predicted oxidoreductase
VRYRRFGRSDLEVSEVGFGVWTLASDWWGVVEDKQGLLRAALDAGINFIDTAPVYGEAGFGEELLVDVLKAQRSDIVLTTKCGYDIDAARKYPGQSERPHDWEPVSVREQLEASLRRLGTDHIDLYQLHNTRIEPIRSDALWEELEKFKAEGKVRELGVALGPAIGWVDEGLEALQRDIVSLQTVFNVLEQEPGLTFAARARIADGECGLISRVPHASDTLSGRVTPDTVFEPPDHRAHRNRDNMLDNFEKAATLSFLWEPETGRTIGQAAVAGILANPAFTTVLPTVTSVEEIEEYAAAVDVPLTPAEHRSVDELFARNFDHADRYVMPLKSSAGN